MKRRVMETILNPVWCILKSVKICAIRGQNSNESPCNFGVRVKEEAGLRRGSP
jgi:hypothetical protein